MFERFSADEMRRLLPGAMLLAVGSLFLSVSAFPSPSALEVGAYLGGTLAFAAVVVLLTVELRE